MITLLLALAVACFLLLNALTSGAETGLYTVHPLRLRLRADAGDRRCRLLLALFRDPALVVVTVLVVNNIAAFGASLGSQLIFDRFGAAQKELLSLALLTPLFFVLGDAVPKNLFRVDADRLLPRLAPVLVVVIRLFRPITVLVELLLRLPFLGMSPEHRADAFSRPGLTASLSGPEAEGTLSATQRMLAGNVARAATGSVQHAMRDLASLPRLGLADRRAQVEAKARATGARRFAVEDAAGRVIGMVHVYDLLLAPGNDLTVGERVRPVAEVPLEASVLAAIGRIRETGTQLAVVVDRRGEQRGLITMKDLVDEILGQRDRW